MESLSVSLPSLEPGWVWLVGAGPGDPGLLTLHGLNGIRQAEVIVHDALISEETLSLADSDCEIIYAGKRGGKPSLKQPDISYRLIQLAKAKKRVVRLKGGDPFVFGRGGEEALALVSAKIPFRVVPGISAGIGGLSHAGIPLTHREVNSAVTFITGHGTTGEVPSGIDWFAIARGSPVLVIYMAIKHMRTIQKRLIEGGRSPSEPVAFIEKATLPGEKIIETTLGECSRALDIYSVQAPVIVVVGNVVHMRSGLDWLGAIRGRVLTDDPLGSSEKGDAL